MNKINIENQVAQQLAEQTKEGNETGNKLNLEEMKKEYFAKVKLM